MTQHKNGFAIKHDCLVAIGLLAGLSATVQAQSTVPTFQSYPAKILNSKPKAVQIYGKNKRYKTLLTELSKEKINYAGHYALTSYGCGGGCQGVAAYNAKTGHAFLHPAVFSDCYSETHGFVERDYQIKPNSRLLILTGSRGEDIAKCERVYYVVEANQFKQVAHQWLFKQ